MTIKGVITTSEEFDLLIDEIRCRRAFTISEGIPQRDELYRGQLDSTWLIKPSLTRDLQTEQQVIKAERDLITLFKDEISAKNCSHKIFLDPHARGYQNDWEWMMQAQHYGIPTRMLDWTADPKVALFFAVDNSALDHVDGQFLVAYYPTSETKIERPSGIQYYDTHPRDITDTWFLSPGFYSYRDNTNILGETRRQRQYGHFSLQSYEDSLLGLDEQPKFGRSWKETTQQAEPIIEKHIIPAAFKPQLRLDLISKGISGNFLYDITNDDSRINAICDKCKQLLTDISKGEK